MKLRLLSALAASAALAGLFAPAAHAAPNAPEYVRTAYDGTIFEVTDDGAVALDFAEWSARGFPTFVDAKTTYEKILSFPTVIAVSAFDRAGIQIMQDVDWNEYRAAGYPPVRTVAWGEGVSVHKWGTSAELLAEDHTGMVIKLTYGQWREAGYPSYQVRDGRGFVRLSWDAGGGIAYLCDTAAGKGGRVTYEQWTRAGSPTPMAVTRTANDAVWRIASRSSGLSYVGAMNLSYDPSSGLQPPLSNRGLSYPEWVAMGRPAPTTELPPAAWNLSCPAGSPGPWE
ncbi:hypothetical protein OVA26_06350 [Microbacterium sp. SL62]|uniref:hypothetical protein n=1 Tax=Microbacterium sp. SL62 TaxID=2995139 RepID=UPI002275CF5E|nr:hypothetical protein [Microbacterium sp. SL62]MCY1716569.1 hypothetical protein [Microbacterium sp. SL62]